MRALRGSNAAGGARAVNPIVRGWAAYYRGVVSNRVFSNSWTHYMWWLTYKWARHSHPNKSKWWVVDRYFGQFNKARQEQVGVRRPRQRRLPPQVLLDKDRPTRDGQGRGVPGRPGLTQYWADRRRRMTDPAGPTHPATAPQAGRPLPALRGLPPARRPPAPLPRRVGAVDTHHPQSDAQTAHRSHGPARRPGRRKTPSGTHPLPATATAAKASRVSTSDHPPARRGLLEPDAGKARPSGSEGGGTQQCVPPTRLLVAGVTTCRGGRESRPQGEGDQVIGHHRTGRYA